MGVPVFCGPYMQNSQSICFDLCAADAMQQVEDVDALITAIVNMHHDPCRCTRQIAHATAVLEANRGSVAKCLEAILQFKREPKRCICPIK